MTYLVVAVLAVAGLAWVFRAYTARAFRRRIVAATDMVRYGVYLRLHKQFMQRHDRETAGYLAAALTNHLLDTTPGGFAGNEFTASHRELFYHEVAAVQLDEPSRIAVTQAIRASAIAAAAVGGDQAAALAALERLNNMRVIPPNLPVGDVEAFLALAQGYVAESKSITAAA